MTRLVLHIGATKTGTSSLQGALHSSADSLGAAGVVYPRWGRGRHNLIAHHNLCYEVHHGRRQSGAFVRHRGTWTDALAEIERSRADVAVVSSEAFFTDVKDHGVRRLAQILAGWDVQVVIYLRRQLEWLQSGWNQLARFGRADVNFSTFLRASNPRLGMYDNRLAPWTRHFGAPNVDVLVYDDLGPGRDVVGDFAARYLPEQVQLSGNRGRNTKAGVKQLAVIAHAVERCRAMLGPDFALSTRSAKRVSQFFAARDDDRSFSVINYRLALRLYARYWRSNRRVRSLLTNPPPGPIFPPPRPSEFDDYLAPSAIGLHRLDAEEQAFATRLVHEIVKHSSSSAPT